MIELASVTRETFDSSGLSTGYNVSLAAEQAESDVLKTIRSAFSTLPNQPLRHSDLLALLPMAKSVEQSGVEAFRNRKETIFGELNRSIVNGFTVGVQSNLRRLPKPKQKNLQSDVFLLSDYERGIQLQKRTNREMLQAEGTAVTLAVAAFVAAIALLSGGLFANSDMPLYEAVDRFVVPQFADGLTGKVAKDGKHLSLTSYAEGLTRESSQTAVLLGESAVARKAGYDLVQISAHYSACPLCVPWQNAILIDDDLGEAERDGVHELLSTARAAGLFHWNCRHLKRIYIPGQSVADNAPNYDPKTVAMNYELEQMQRRLERQIRAKKRELAMSLTPEAQQAATAKIKNYQAQLRGLVKYANENGYKVYRQNWKEQVSFEYEKAKPYRLQSKVGLSSGESVEHPYGKILSEKSYDDLSAELERAEKEIAQYEVEHAYVFTRDGRAIHVEGNRFTVDTTAVGADALRGAVVTHNHPHELRAPSMQDLQSISRDGIAELRTVDKTNLYVVRFEKPITEKIVNDIYKQAMYAALEKARAGEIEIIDENASFLEEFLKLVSGVYYERLRR